jgi:hypothetical protein
MLRISIKARVRDIYFIGGENLRQASTLKVFRSQELFFIGCLCLVIPYQ